jgi:DNA-binding PadR family transcriptional regulator
VALTTTSYAILGLLDLRDWTAYELTQQARRSLAFVWPVSESQLYAEPKRLEREGLVSISTDPVGPRRTRQLLAITDDGRAALRAWLATEPSAPRMQMEALLRTLFAPAGTKADLLAALDSTSRAASDAFDYGESLIADYQAGRNPFPERVHVNILWMVFVHDMLRLLLDWAEFARGEVEQWSDTTTGGDPARVERLIDAMLEGQSLVVPSARQLT